MSEAARAWESGGTLKKRSGKFGRRVGQSPSAAAFCHGDEQCYVAAMGDTVRFSIVTAAAGTPEVYLPLADPKHDRNFMRAVREDRVLSLKQEPTGTRKDFGAVGFVEEKFVSYLIFAKSLRQFAGKRVVGIKYDTLRPAEMTTPRAHTVSARGRSTKPKPKTKPRPKRFTATVRITATNEVQVTVMALDEKQARSRAEDAARRRKTFSPTKVEAELLDLHPQSTAGN